MKKVMLMSVILMLSVVFSLSLMGCQMLDLRNAASESQKQIAWNGNLAAMVIEREGTDAHSPAAKKLVQATQIAMTDVGLPDNPNIVNYETTVAQAQEDAASKPTMERNWQLVDSALELGIGVASLFGGIYGVKAVGYLRTARQKSDALKEVVKGNELLKTVDRAAYETMKKSQQSQTPKTKQVIAAVKINAG